MKKKTQLKDYLQLWKEHFASDVEGQSVETQHLGETKLKEMANEGGIANADPAEVEHLSTCPTCLEEWSQLCGGDTGDCATAMPIFYGTSEDDVTGQGATPNLTCDNGYFTLSIDRSPESNKFILTFVATTPNNFEGRSIQVRAKEGQLLLDGQVQNGKLTAEISAMDEIDISVWTLIVK